VERIAHSYKGSAGYFDLARLSEAARSLEAHCKAGERRSVESSIETWRALIEELEIADLNRQWRFHISDDPSWANPGFDDSHWRFLKPDQPWSASGEMDVDGFAWYRAAMRAGQVNYPRGGWRERRTLNSNARIVRVIDFERALLISARSTNPSCS
jgi:HPt (histidine-containing phosphotransfer) domain-containing protein